MEDIFRAARDNALELMETILEREPDKVLARDKHQWTPLHAAVSCARLEAAELLLRKGADPNAQGNASEAPLHLAMDVRVAQLLVDNGGNPALEDRNGWTPLSWALRDRNLELFAVLAAGAPQLGSPQYQLLRESYLRKQFVNGRYHGRYRTFRVVKLGWTERNERCLAWQVSGSDDAGWRCFEVGELSDLQFEGPWQPLPPEADIERAPQCVVVVDNIRDGVGSHS
jgi:hypothetical protein